MRILPAAVACAMTLALVGCGRGGNDNEMRASMRENAINQCVTASRDAPNNAQYDWPRLCTCVTDRYMAGRSTSDLQNADAQDPARRVISRQCAIEQMSATLGAIANGQAENSATPAN